MYKEESILVTCTLETFQQKTKLHESEVILQRGQKFDFDVPLTDLSLTSVFFSSCDSVVGDFLEFNQANRGSLCV